MNARRVLVLVTFVLVASPVVVLGQAPTRDIDPASLPRSSFTWNAAELEVGLANWDAVFPGRAVSAGTDVRALPKGPDLAAIAGDELDHFIVDQKVAGLLVLHLGRIRLERYGLGHNRTGHWTSQSVAKSVTSTLVGAAVEAGFIGSIDDPVTTYIPGLRGSPYDSVSVRHLMTMTSGVKWNEDYSDPESDIARFYSAPVNPAFGATVSYMRGLEGDAVPGSKWVYKTGETHLLGVLVSSATGRTLADYLSETIWQPYGMEYSASWSTDRSGHELGGCCLQVALRDYARFGQFVLEGGRIGSRSIVPEGWFEAATDTQVDFESSGQGYGYQWWTSDDGTFRAIGIHGQLLHVDRRRELVVVINSAWPEATSAERSAVRDELLAAISQAIDQER